MLNSSIKLVILICSSLFLISSGKLNKFNEIKNEINLKVNEKIVIIFQNGPSCIKCYQSSKSLIECIKVNSKIKFKLLCFFRVSRKKELNLFKEQYNWVDFLMIDNGNLRNNIGLKINTDFAIFNHNGRILIELNQSEIIENVSFCCKKVMKILK